MASALQSYLQSLNTSESQWGLWVNPENPTEEYRIGQYCFENGGIKDDWVCVGSLDKLSFGFQSDSEALETFLEQNDGGLDYNDRKVLFNKQGLLDAWSNDSLDEEFRSFLEAEIEKIQAIWSEEEAWNFVVNKLPEILESAKQLEGIYG